MMLPLLVVLQFVRPVQLCSGLYAAVLLRQNEATSSIADLEIGALIRMIRLGFLGDKMYELVPARAGKLEKNDSKCSRSIIRTYSHEYVYNRKRVGKRNLSGLFIMTLRKKENKSWWPFLYTCFFGSGGTWYILNFYFYFSACLNPKITKLRTKTTKVKKRPLSRLFVRG